MKVNPIRKKGGVHSHWLYKGLKKIISQPELIKSHVNEAKKKLGKDKDIVADYLIKKKTEITATVGALTGAVGVVPVIGGIGAVATTITAELIIVTHQEIELCLEIADNYGCDITNDERLPEILTIIGEKKEIKNSKALTKLATHKTIEKIVRRYTRVGILKALRRVALRLELKVGLKAFTKVVPLLGMGFGALINYRIVKNTGILAKEFYRSKHKY